MAEIKLFLNHKVYVLKSISEEHPSPCESCCFFEGGQKMCPVLSDARECSETNLCWRIQVDGKSSYFIEDTIKVEGQK